MKALGFREYSPESFYLKFREMGYEVEKSPIGSHFKDANLIGASFLVASRAELTINYGKKSFKMEIK